MNDEDDARSNGSASSPEGKDPDRFGMSPGHASENSGDSRGHHTLRKMGPALTEPDVRRRDDRAQPVGRSRIVDNRDSARDSRPRTVSSVVFSSAAISARESPTTRDSVITSR